MVLLPAAAPLQLSRFIDSAAEIAAEAQGLMRALRVPPEDMRGVGITVLILPLARRWFNPDLVVSHSPPSE
jgi:hypothetical protein